MSRLRMRALAVLAGAISLLAAGAGPAAAQPSDPVGNPAPDVANRLSMLFCDPTTVMEEGEAFTVMHGNIVEPGVNSAIGRYTFDLTLNGVLLKPTRTYHSVSFDPLWLTRTSLYEFPDGLATGDVLLAQWFDPEGLTYECETTIENT